MSGCEQCVDGRQTDAEHGVDDVGDGRQTDALFVSAQIARQIGGQPLHDYVITPIHGEVRDIYRPKRPVTDELSPPHVLRVDLRVDQRQLIVTNVSDLRVQHNPNQNPNDS